MTDALLGTEAQPVAGLSEWAAQHGFAGQAREGGVRFDVPLISHIEGNLWTGGCIGDLVLPEHFRHVVSLYPWEGYRIASDAVSRLEVPLYDSREHPLDREQLVAIAAWVNQACRRGPTLVHCQAGLNRSGLVAALALCLGGMMPALAIQLLRERRSSAVLCNKAFEAWLLEERWRL